MTWRDQLRDASFRDVPFFVDSAEQTGGRRAIVHEFPLRDVPQTEDLGRRAAGFSIDAYVIGPEYFAARDRLIAALQESGPGTLVHPYLGELQVQIGEIRWREGTREGGYCQFTIQCFESSPVVYPRPLVDTRGAVEARTDTAEDAAAAAFAEVFSVDDQPQRVIDAARDVVLDAVDALERATARITTVPDAYTTFVGLADRLSSAASSLVLAPVELAGELIGLVRQLVVAAQRPQSAFDALRTLFGWGGDLEPVPTTTPSRVVQGHNQAALVQLVQQLATLEAGRAASQADFESADDALRARDALIEQIDLLSEADIDDAIYQALTGARAAVSRDISQRGAQLPRLVRIQLPDTLPALTLAWALYADASRGDELARRNRLRDPLFVPGGLPLEALDE